MGRARTLSVVSDTTDRVTDVVTFGVLALVGVRLVSGLRQSLARQGRDLVRRIVRGIRWRHIWPAPFGLAGVVVVGSALVQLPGLDWGWWSAFGGEGSPVFGSSTSTSGTALEWLVPLVFMCLLIPALPLFAYAEERMFRRSAESWSTRRRMLKVVQFGLIHALIGIPIGYALALSVGGASFMATYLHAFRRTGSVEEATMESTRAHTAYNGLIIALVVVAIVIDGVT